MIACAKWLGRTSETCTRKPDGCICEKEEKMSYEGYECDMAKVVSQQWHAAHEAELLALEQKRPFMTGDPDVVARACGFEPDDLVYQGENFTPAIRAI